MQPVWLKTNLVNETEQRLEDIRSMMTAGHRSIRLEKHTLVNWGVTGGLLCAGLPFVYERLTDRWMMVAIFMAAITIALGAVAVMDIRETRRLRHQQDESISFIQKQITHIWWMLIATAILLAFGMAMYGGSYLDVPMWIYIVGLGLIIHGLFSSQPLSRFGFMLIVLAIFSAFFLPYNGTRWLAASLFGIGMPLIARLLYSTSGFFKGAGMAQLFTWLFLVSVPAYAAYSIETMLRTPPPDQAAVARVVYKGDMSPQGDRIADSRIPSDKKEVWELKWHQHPRKDGSIHR